MATNFVSEQFEEIMCGGVNLDDWSWREERGLALLDQESILDDYNDEIENLRKEYKKAARLFRTEGDPRYEEDMVKFKKQGVDLKEKIKELEEKIDKSFGSFEFPEDEDVVSFSNEFNGFELVEELKRLIDRMSLDNMVTWFEGLENLHSQNLLNFNTYVTCSFVLANRLKRNTHPRAGWVQEEEKFRKVYKGIKQKEGVPIPGANELVAYNSYTLNIEHAIDILNKVKRHCKSDNIEDLRNVYCELFEKGDDVEYCWDLV